MVFSEVGFDYIETLVSLFFIIYLIFCIRIYLKSSLQVMCFFFIYLLSVPTFTLVAFAYLFPNIIVT